MTKISFYVLPEGDDALPFACRVTEKAFRLGQPVYLHCPDDSRAQTLDDMLWTFRQGSFIPHRIVRGEASAPALEPVLIGINQPPSPGPWDVLVNLSAEVPEFFSRYERVAEVVDANAARREQSRERYRFYRDRGYKLNTHQV